MDRNHNDAGLRGMPIDSVAAAGPDMNPAILFQQIRQIAVFHRRLQPNTHPYGATTSRPGDDPQVVFTVSEQEDYNFLTARLPHRSEVEMSDANAQKKLVCITQTSMGQQILDREFWQKLEKPLGWRLWSFSGRQSAEFFTAQNGAGMWDGLSPVTPALRASVLTALGMGEVVRAERQSAPPVSVPLAPVVPFPRNK